MKSTKGMLGGHFSKAVDDPSRYLVSTIWDSIENHNNYTKQKLPIFKLKSDVKNDINKIIGRQIVLVDSWNIVNKNA